MSLQDMAVAARSYMQAAQSSIRLYDRKGKEQDRQQGEQLAQKAVAAYGMAYERSRKLRLIVEAAECHLLFRSDRESHLRMCVEILGGSIAAAEDEAERAALRRLSRMLLLKHAKAAESSASSLSAFDLAQKDARKAMSVRAAKLYLLAANFQPEISHSFHIYEKAIDCLIAGGAVSSACDALSKALSCAQTPEQKRRAVLKVSGAVARAANRYLDQGYGTLARPLVRELEGVLISYYIKPPHEISGLLKRISNPGEYEPASGKLLQFQRRAKPY